MTSGSSILAACHSFPDNYCSKTWTQHTQSLEFQSMAWLRIGGTPSAIDQHTYWSKKCLAHQRWNAGRGTWQQCQQWAAKEFRRRTALAEQNRRNDAADREASLRREALSATAALREKTRPEPPAKRGKDVSGSRVQVSNGWY